jgi:hypothetical protein
MSKTYLITITQADLETIILRSVNRAFSLYVISTSFQKEVSDLGNRGKIKEQLKVKNKAHQEEVPHDE